LAGIYREFILNGSAPLLGNCWSETVIHKIDHEIPKKPAPFAVNFGKREGKI